MSLDGQLITLAVDDPDTFVTLQRLGITADDFEENYKRVWNYLYRMKRQNGSIPSREIVKGRFDFIRWSRVRSQDIPVLVHDIRQRRRYNDFLALLMDATRECRDPDDLADVLGSLQSGINALAYRNGDNPLVDVTSRSFRKPLFEEIRRRRSDVAQGVLTGFPTLDRVTGGLQAGHEIVTIGRAGSGKTWMNLFFVAEAIMQGKKVIVYPLEMTIYESVMRLYTVFSQKLFGGRRTFKNLDLSQGRINKAKFVKFLSILEDRYNGQLLISDISKINGPYTIDRIEAEVEVHQPHMFWVDYLTLMKAPNVGKDDTWMAIMALGEGIKGIAMRHHTIGGCSAQVNREFLKSRAKLPRLEHISFGDALGASADQIISIAKQNDGTILYALIKNRHGAEIPQVVCRTSVNVGEITEVQLEESDDDE